MANPKSKIPIIRPRSEDTLLRKSKNNDKDITVIRQRAKSGNNEKKRSDKGKTKHSDDANLGNMIQSQDVRKDLNVGERKENETHKYFIPERKGRNKKTSFVVRIDRVGDKDVLVAEEIGQGWTESSENDKEQKEYTDNVLNNHTALNETEFTGKVDPYSGDSGDSFKETDSNFGPKLISDVSAASIDKQLSELSKTRSRIKGQATFDDEPKSTDIQVKNNVLTHANLRKLDQNKSNIIKRTNDIRLHTERSNTSRTWTPSSTNTQAVYLRSLKPDNSRHDNNRTQTDIFQVTAQDHSDIGRDHVPNRILSEITFIKDNSNGNFERIKSSESNFSHFSKAKRGNTFRVSSSSSRFRGSKSLGSMSEKLVERFEEVKSESIDNMNVDIKDNNEVNDNQETFQTKITKLSKRRIPVRKKLPPDYTNSPVIPSTSSSKTTEKNRVLETLNNHNAFESSASRLNSAEFINQDLKLVKRKVKNNVMTEFNKTNGKITLKKNLLSNVNKNKGKQVKNPVNEIFLGTGKHSAVVVLERASQYSQESETVDSHSYRGSKLYPLRVKDKRSGKGKHRATVKNVCTQTTWFIQPKIHRHKADTQKRKSKTLMYQSSHKSVQTWLMNSSVKSKEKANIDRYADENSPNKYRNVQQRLKKAPQPNKDKRRLSRFSDDVKKGEYLPLRRVSKQSEKKVDQKSNKNVDQLTGYEFTEKKRQSMMPSPSEKTEAGKHGNDDKKLVRRDTGRELKLRDGKKKLPFSKEDRSNSSKTVTVNENRAIDEEEEYLNDVNDRFENDDTQDDKIQPDKVDDADRDMDEYERKMNETANKDDVNYDKTNKASEENEFRRDSMKTQNSRRQDDKRQSISHYQSGGGGETKQITRNDSKRNVTAPKKYPFNRYNSYKDARSRIDTGRDRNVRKSVDTGRNMVVDRRQSHAIVEEDQEQVETDRFGRLRGYRFNEESESFDLIDYRDEWEESPENDNPTQPDQDNSEIPVLYNSDDDEVYTAPRPLTDTERARYPNHRRYEGENDNFRANYRDAAHKKLGKTAGALVRFFRNGDPEYNGLPVVVNNAYRNFETLLVDLNGKIPTPTGVKYVFKWPEGNEVTSVKEFQNRCVYVCSSTKQLKRNVNYGESREKFWVNKKPSAGKMRKTEKQLFKRPVSPKGSPTSNSPLIVTVINNLSRDKREKVILNPQTQQTFEEWKSDIDCSEIPVKTLHSEKHPYSEVTSFSGLFRELRINRNFIAVGDEGLPLEIMKKRQAPSSNSSSDSVKDVRSRRKKQNRKREEMDQIYEQGRPDSPRSGVMSRYDMGPRTMFGQRGRPIDNRRNLKDCVEIEIDGQMKEFIPPSYLDPQDDGAKPDKNLKCEWIYGFRGKDSRHNLTILPRTGELVYYVAAVVILYDKERDTQRHYMKHNEEITCMSIHPNQYLIATGQLHGKEPEHSSHVRIWHGVSLSTYSVIGVGVFSGGISSIGFSNDGAGNLMCALDGSDKHVLSVWEWQTERVLARTMTSTDAVHACCFYPDDSNNSILITHGAKHIYFWKIFYDAARKREAKILRDRNSGIFEDEIPKSINCVAFLPAGHVVTGDTNGNIMLWTKDTTDAFVCSIVMQAHNCPISSLCMLEDGTLLSGAGNEIKAWDTNSNFRAVKARQIPQEAGTVRSIVTQSVGGIDGKLYIGTTKGCILDGSLQLKFRYTVQGHSEGVSGVCPHPFEPTFVTAGQDQVVIKWSLVTHKVIWKSHIESTSACLAVDHRHELVAIGSNEGSFITLNAYNGMHVSTVQVDPESKGRIGCLAFSPDGMLLAVGCEDGLINIYAIHDRGQRYQKFNMPLKGHNARVIQLDWSTDGRCIESVGEDQELLFWDVDSMQQIKIPRMMRDVDWFTDTCTVAFGNIGPWTNLEKGELIKVVSRSNYRDFLVAGDTKGRLRLYKYPCSKEKGEYRQMRLYSSEVSGVAFTPDNRSLLSCGGNDGLALVQWNLSDEQ